VRSEVITSAAASFRLISAGALLAALAGCCASYSRVAVIERRADGSPSAAALVSVVRRAAQPPVEIEPWKNKELPPNRAYFEVSEGRNALTVVIDFTKPSISLGWPWITRSDFVRQIQSAIGREFTATFGGELQFRDNPCNWLGP
jgi:hypothetical protein